jgi:hypothetical protein
MHLLQQIKSLHCCSTSNVANEINGNEIEIGFLKTTFIRGNLAVENHTILYFYGNVIMKNENALCEKDSPPLILNNPPNFREEIGWNFRTINSKNHFLCVLG